jgi:quinol monooxygenase YgiN
MDMLIIAGYVEVPADRRDAYVAALHDLVLRARRAPGCHDVAITPDPTDPTRVYNYERWESWDHLDAWRAVACAPDVDVPMVGGDMHAYEIARVRAPFD